MTSSQQALRRDLVAAVLALLIIASTWYFTRPAPSPDIVSGTGTTAQADGRVLPPMPEARTNPAMPADATTAPARSPNTKVTTPAGTPTSVATRPATSTPTTPSTQPATKPTGRPAGATLVGTPASSSSAAIPAESSIAATSKAVGVYSAPNGKKLHTLPRLTEMDGPQRLLVAGSADGWVKVYLPTRPNGSTGWIRAVDVTIASNPYRIEVSKKAHKVTVYKAGAKVTSFTAAVGRPSSPTPSGLFYVVDRVVTGRPKGSYGPNALGLSGHSNVYTEFGSGDGDIALHGTNEPALLGRSVSHGCVRLANTNIAKLYSMVPAGTPVHIY